MSRKSIDHLGRTYLSFRDMCAAYNKPDTTVMQRLERGWTIERALTEPVKEYRKRKNKEVKSSVKPSVIDGACYRHFSGRYYRVVTTAICFGTGEKYVVYTELFGNYRNFLCTYTEFTSPVDTTKHPNCEQEYCFELVTKYFNDTE